MAVGNLDERKTVRCRLRRADQTRDRHPSRDRPDNAGPRPDHAFQRLTAVQFADFVVSHESLLDRRKTPPWGGDSSKAGFIPGRRKKSPRLSCSREKSLLPAIPRAQAAGGEGTGRLTKTSPDPAPPTSPDALRQRGCARGRACLRA